MCSQPEPYCPLWALERTVAADTAAQRAPVLDDAWLLPASKGCEYAWRRLIEGLYLRTLEELRRRYSHRPQLLPGLPDAAADALIEHGGQVASTTSVGMLASQVLSSAVRLLDRDRKREGRRGKILQTFSLLKNLVTRHDPDDLAQLRDLNPVRRKPRRESAPEGDDQGGAETAAPVEPRLKVRESPGVGAFTLRHGASSEEFVARAELIEKVLSDQDKRFVTELVKISEDLSSDAAELPRLDYERLLTKMRAEPELALYLGFEGVPKSVSAIKVRMHRIRERLAAALHPETRGGKAPGGKNDGS